MFDMKNLARIGRIEAGAPAAMQAFAASNEAALANGAVPRKYQELKHSAWL